MMKKSLLLVVIACSLLACEKLQTSIKEVNESQEAEEISIEQAKTKNWQLIEAFDANQKPLLVNSKNFQVASVKLFIKNNTIYLQGFCTPFHVDFLENKATSTISTDVVNFDDAICNDQDNLQVSQAIIDFFNKQDLRLVHGKLNERLIFSNQGKHTLVFKDLLSNKTSFHSDNTKPKTAYMEIKPNEQCKPGADCYAVREVFYTSQFEKTHSEWRPLDFEIKNLYLSPDFTVIVKLNIVEPIDNNGPKYTLDTVLEQVPINH